MNATRPHLTPELLAQAQAIHAWLAARVAPTARICADTRTLDVGDVFVAYPVGNARQRTDNRGWISQALEAGAAAVLCDTSDGFVVPADASVLPVDNLAAVIGPIVARWLGEPSARLRVVGVTGTNGKTTITQWIAQALGDRCAVIGTLGSGFVKTLRPSGYTTPDAAQLQATLAALIERGADAVAIEVSSHGLDQGRVNGVRFDTAVFTNLTQDHLDYHGNLDEYAQAKRQLFGWQGLRCAVVNGDDPCGAQLAATLDGELRLIVTHTDSVPATSGEWLRAQHIACTERGTAFEIEGQIAGERRCAQLRVDVLGAFNVQNLLAVLGVLLTGGCEWDDAIGRLQQLQPVSGRLEQFGGHGGPLVVIDYAHTPDALDKVLQVMRPVAAARGGELWCVFGCGGDRDSSKRPLMGAIAEQRADHLVITSDNPRHEDPEAIIGMIVAGLKKPASARQVVDRAAGILQAVRNAGMHDVVVVAGKGHEATQEIAGRKVPFADQQHVGLALAARGVLA